MHACANGLGSASQRVLMTPELVRLIFSFMTISSIARNVSVCSLWTEIALDAVWRDIDDLYPLLNILAPMEKVDNDYHFTRLPEPRDWTRFQKYGKRVRQIHFDEEKGSFKHILEDISKTRTVLNILPKLHTLEWVASDLQSLVEHSVLFMHENVKCFIAQFPSCDSNPGVNPAEHIPGSFYRNIAARMPALEQLDAGVYGHIDDVEEDILELLTSLSHLQVITLPKYHLTSSIVERLSRMKTLKVVLSHHNMGGWGSGLDLPPFVPCLTEGAFSGLTSLSLSACLEDITKFIRSPYAPTHVLDLYIESPVWQSPASVHELLVAIAERCSALDHLSLKLIDEVGFTRGNPRESPDRITFHTLLPLLSLPRIASFEITHVYPLQLSEHDIEQLACALPALQNLNLNCAPVIQEQPTLTLAALLPFARRCPKLKHLGLYLNASRIGIPSLHQTFPFRKLSKLCTGLSKISSPDRDRVAVFLSRILPTRGCNIECGISWNPSFIEEQSQLAVEERCNAWIEIARFLPLLLRARREEREIMGLRECCTCDGRI